MIQISEYVDIYTYPGEFNLRTTILENYSNYDFCNSLFQIMMAATQQDLIPNSAENKHALNSIRNILNSPGKMSMQLNIMKHFFEKIDCGTSGKLKDLINFKEIRDAHNALERNIATLNQYPTAMKSTLPEAKDIILANKTLMLQLNTLLQKFKVQFLDNVDTSRFRGSITTGDAHSNPMKLIHMLVKEGILAITENDYQTLSDTYQKYYQLFKLNPNPFDSEDEPRLRHTFIETLRALKLGPNSECFVRFLGDLLADRGLNDHFIIELLTTLHSLRINFSINLSNHDTHYLNFSSKEYDLTDTEMNYLLKNFQGLSLINFDIIVPDLDDTELARVESFISTVYLPRLELISYTLDSSGGITLFSHAAMAFESIEAICDYYSVEYNDSTAIFLGQSIDKLNIAFKEQCNTKAFDKKQFTSPPFHDVIWKRHDNPQTTPLPNKAYTCRFVHGHDEHSTYPRHASVTLDGQLGKHAERNQGIYSIVSSNYSPAPRIESSLQSNIDVGKNTHLNLTTNDDSATTAHTLLALLATSTTTTSEQATVSTAPLHHVSTSGRKRKAEDDISPTLADTNPDKTKNSHFKPK